LEVRFNTIFLKARIISKFSTYFLMYFVHRDDQEFTLFVTDIPDNLIVFCGFVYKARWIHPIQWLISAVICVN
jgi:hypothetical protein